MEGIEDFIYLLHSTEMLQSKKCWACLRYIQQITLRRTVNCTSQYNTIILILLLNDKTRRIMMKLSYHIDK